MSAVPTVTLNSGTTVPVLGLGTWQSKPGEVGAAVKAAFAAGYRHIDCATCYGNEAEVGSAFAEVFGAGEIKRADVFITSKLWNSEHKPEHVRPALDKCLADLRLDYLDLYLIHWPQAFQHVDGATASFPRNEDGTMKYETETSLVETWRAMEELVAAGKVKAIGLSNFNAAQLEEIHAAATVKPAMLQVEVNPYFSQEALIAKAKALGVHVTGYSPLGTGAGKNAKGETVATNSVLAEIGTKYNKSAAQVAIAHILSRGVICIPKSVQAERIQQNFDVLFELSDEDKAKVTALNEDKRSGWGGPPVERNGEMRPRDEEHPNYPFKGEYPKGEKPPQ